MASLTVILIVTQSNLCTAGLNYSSRPVSLTLYKPDGWISITFFQNKEFQA